VRKGPNPLLIVLAVVALGAVVYFVFMKPSSADEETHNVNATLDKIKPREGSPTLPDGGAVPGVAGPTKMR